MHLFGFIIIIFHDVRSAERQITSVGRLGSAVGRLPLPPELILASFAIFRIVEQPGFNLLKPNVNYSGRTATLTSKIAFYIFIQQI